ncbi:MAG: hypothetical protein J0I47_03350 [Sphingomonas sp.]|uniref:hypothetical protein n=1 Tax=Sphingomonas sp. TaxID=28214 RepID=UPI001AC8EE64|nr:hypothetical protein [Sphingomonas sp.]MBN8807263.1 hypothetical protein [Sphingomonas sp.]
MLATAKARDSLTQINLIPAERAGPSRVVSPSKQKGKGRVMGKGCILWLLGVPIPVIILLLLIFHH